MERSGKKDEGNLNYICLNTEKGKTIIGYPFPQRAENASKKLILRDVKLILQIVPPGFAF